RFVYSSASLSDFAPHPGAGLADFLTDPSGRDSHTSIASDLDLSRLGRKPRDRRLFRLGIRLTDEIVVQTEEQVRMCEAHFGRQPFLIRSIAELAPESDSPPEAFLWIGRVVSYKRAEEFLELAHNLREAKF